MRAMSQSSTWRYNRLEQCSLQSDRRRSHRSGHWGNSLLAACACAWNAASSIPGHFGPRSSDRCSEMAKPPPDGPKCTWAVVWTRVAGWPAVFPASPRTASRNSLRVRAPMSSSGFVPSPDSIRDRNENGPLNAPLPSSIVPAPVIRPAVPLRVRFTCRHITLSSKF